MTWLLIGLALWWGAHLFKRVAPGLRAQLGDRGKGLVAGLLLLATLLMVIGYRGAELVPVYSPIAGAGHVNNLLMLLALYLFGVGSTPGGWLKSRMHHPMLAGMLIWAVAHLLVNGDRASLILFGGLGIWAIVEMALINRAEGPWVRPAPGSIAKDARAAAIWLVLYGVIAGVHIWLGHNPFMGNY